MNKQTEDYKAWISEKAYELAEKYYGCDYYELSQNLQAFVYQQALDLWADELARKIDKSISMIIKNEIYTR